MSAVVVLGAQWGDEGKAKIIDLLAEKADVIIRYQGGCNAGHTVVHQGETFKFHLIPSGVLYANKQCVIGPGTVIYPEVFQQELNALRERGIKVNGLTISARAHITLPYHVAIDEARENRLGDNKIGTTKRGIGPTYEDKVGRVGLRAGDLMLSDALLTQRLESIVADKNPILQNVYGLPPINVADLLEKCQQYRQWLAPFVSETDVMLHSWVASNAPILLEGAQGTMLDVDHGTYPYVTSSNPTAGGACVGAGLSPRAISRVIGVTKAYTTRVGEGPFPTELFDAAGEHMVTVGVEVGTTTGRKRRCGWFDAVAMRYAAQVNGMDGLAITKLDVLTGLSEVKLAVAYRDKTTGHIHDYFPSQLPVLANMEPVYETLPGWTECLTQIRSYDQLPLAARQFVERLSSVVGVPVSMVSVGPDRQETIIVDEVFKTSAKTIQPTATLAAK